MEEEPLNLCVRELKRVGATVVCFLEVAVPEPVLDRHPKLLKLARLVPPTTEPQTSVSSSAQIKTGLGHRSTDSLLSSPAILFTTE